jgi:hypothetical protein
MVTRQQIITLHQRRPFQPIRVCLSNGRTLIITHPENLAYGLRGDEIAIFEGEDFHLLDLAQIEAFELVPASRP